MRILWFEFGPIRTNVDVEMHDGSTKKVSVPTRRLGLFSGWIQAENEGADIVKEKPLNAAKIIRNARDRSLFRRDLRKSGVKLPDEEPPLPPEE